MKIKKNVLGIFLMLSVLCFFNNNALAQNVCLSWDWDGDIANVQFKIYYSELVNLPYLGTFITQGSSPIITKPVNTNGKNWATCLEMPTAINSYYAVTAVDITNGLESDYSNVVYADFALPIINKYDKAVFHIDWSN